MSCGIRRYNDIRRPGCERFSCPCGTDATGDLGCHNGVIDFGRETINKKKLGDRGEETAAAFLISRGFIIDAMKWRESRYELDIVARKNGLLVFVEVKSSRGGPFGPPELKVTRAKQRRIAKAASEYISHLIELPDEIRFDVIGVLWRANSPAEIRHIEAAFIVEND